MPAVRDPALGLNIAVGWAGLLDLGYIAFFGFGAYGYALFSSTALGTARHRRRRICRCSRSIPIVVVAAGVVGVLIGLVALRLEGDYLAIVTLFVGQAFVEFVNNVDPGRSAASTASSGSTRSTASAARPTPRGYYFVALIFCRAAGRLLHLLDTSRTGRAWRALRDDPLAARAMTIPVNKLKVMAFSFGAIVGALAGALFAAQQSQRVPDQLHREHPDPDLRLPRARRRRQHRRRDRSAASS